MACRESSPHRRAAGRAGRRCSPRRARTDRVRTDRALAAKYRSSVPCRSRWSRPRLVNTPTRKWLPRRGGARERATTPPSPRHRFPSSTNAASRCCRSGASGVVCTPVSVPIIPVVAELLQRASHDVGGGRLAIGAGDSHHVQRSTRFAEGGGGDERHRRPRSVDDHLWHVRREVQLVVDHEGGAHLPRLRPARARGRRCARRARRRTASRLRLDVSRTRVR